ncbi:MAG: hypothetical protein CFE23_05950 [Flavobacterium sp. BFFFF1]|uniref:energy transducer TonB n=1 Tax=Flavobacterium sp. BFFFF1 TaxID=2015557 RepID=UPI000BD1B26A|nr:energy transducer TonB [Flavobacterium sp. BFFFF1]OYU81035.1 MAG: hypothetical protein CFE23_05950 [Flavobacterium sp. BFFFF1]
MSDQELFDFFKNGRDAFDEMPSDNLWNKIDTGLKAEKAVKKAAATKTLLISVIALLTVFIGIILYIVLTDKEQNQLPRLPQKQEVIVPQILTDSVVTIDTMRREIRKEIRDNAPEKKRNAAEKETIDELSIDKKEDQRTIEPKTEPQVYRVTSATKEPEVIANTEVYKNRIVIRATNPLTDAEYELLKKRAVEKNQSETGKLLIIFAPGRPAYRVKLKPAPRHHDSLTLKPTTASFAQKEQLLVGNAIVYESRISKDSARVDTFQPTFKGGISAFNSFIQKNFRIPEGSFNGKIMVSFVIEPDGSMTGLEVLKDLGHGTKEEALRVFKALEGHWIPAYQDGKPVRSKYSVPLTINSN